MEERDQVSVSIHLRGEQASFAFGRDLTDIRQASFAPAKDPAQNLRFWTAPETMRELYGSICQFIEKTGALIRDLVLVVPDHFGAREYILLWRAARQAGVPLLRIISETLAAALAHRIQYPAEDGLLLVLCVGSGARSAADLEIDQGVVQTLQLYGSFSVARGETREEEDLLALRLCGALQRLMGLKDYSRFLLVGEREVRERYERLLRRKLAEVKRYFGADDARKNAEKKICQLEETTLASGGLAYALSLGGRYAAPWDAVVSSLPEGLFLSHRGEILPLLDQDRTFPCRSTALLSEYTDPAWYEGEWVVHECFREQSPRECGRFTVSSLPGRSDAGGEFTLDVDREGGYGLTLQLRWGGRLLQWVLREDLRVSPGWETVAPAPADAPDRTEEFLLGFLPVVDSLEYGVRYIQPGDESPHAQGLVNILRQAKELLGKLEVVEIQAMGAPFDARLHNAVAKVPDLSLPPDTVREVMQTGYLYKGRVLRHASVIVSG